jgi:hypothetical protein
LGYKDHPGLKGHGGPKDHSGLKEQRALRACPVPLLIEVLKVLQEQRGP